MTAKAAFWRLMAALVIVCGYAPLSNGEPRRITEDEKKFCRGLPQIMRRVWTPKQRTAGLHGQQRAGTPHDCVEALIDAGEVSRSDAERRKTSSR